MPPTAHEIFGCEQSKDISYHGYHQQAGLTVRNPSLSRAGFSASQGLSDEEARLKMSFNF